jgi:signal transduction histidine kinase
VDDGSTHECPFFVGRRPRALGQRALMARMLAAGGPPAIRGVYPSRAAENPHAGVMLAPPVSILEQQRLQQLLDLGRELVSELDLDVLLPRILVVARELTGARYAALGVLDAGRTELERFHVAGIDAAHERAIGDHPHGHGVLGVLIDDPRPLRVADVGTHPKSFGFPPGHPPMHTFLGAPVLIRGEAWGNLYLTEKVDGEFTEQDEASLVVLADWAAIAIDNARVHREVRAQRDELGRAVRALEATTDIARAVGGEIELARVLELIVKRARALVEARTLLLLLREGADLTVSATAGELGRAVAALRVPLADSVAGQVLRTGRPERLTDAATRLRTSFGDVIEACSEMLVPVVFRNQPLGVLVAFDRLADGPGFSREDERLLVAFAASAATAIATAQSAAARGLRLSIESADRERRHWARELHDDTLQELGALKVLLSAARRSERPEVTHAALGQALEQIDHGIRELRALITELRPAALDQLGVHPAIEALVQRVREQSSAHVACEIDLAHSRDEHPTRLAPELEGVIYRLVQEALTNAVKHAHATRITVDVSERDGTVVLAVADDGTGFDPDAETDGFGIVGMRERAALGGGRVEVESAGGRGTTVRAVFPARHIARPVPIANLS